MSAGLAGGDCEVLPRDGGRRPQDRPGFHLPHGSRRLAVQLHAAAQAPRAARFVRFRLRHPRRGSVHQESGCQGDADLLRRPRAAPAGADRHAAREPAARSLEHLPLPPAGAPRLPRRLRGGAHRRPRGDARPAARSAGPLHPAADEERGGPGAPAQGRDGSHLPADRRAAGRVCADLLGGAGAAGRRCGCGDAGEVIRLPRASHPAAPDLLRSGHAALAQVSADRFRQDQPPDGETGGDRGQRAQGGHLFPVRDAARPRAGGARAALSGIAALRADGDDPRPAEAGAGLPAGERGGGDARVAQSRGHGHHAPRG